MAYDRIFFLKLPYRGLLTLKVILHALKDKIRVLILRKGITSELGGRLHEKGCGLMRAFGRQGQCTVFGQKVNGERVEHRWNHLTFTLPLYPFGQRVFFCPFTL